VIQRHLYLTDEKTKVPATDLLDIIYAPCIQSFQAPDATLEDWLNLSYRHFYLRYAFPKLQVKSWRERKKLGWQELHVCTPCCKERLKGRKQLQEFLRDMKAQPLPTLDLFGGVGAFSKGLREGSGCLKVTHAIEIGPSAAKTFRRVE
jgi:DNA (cytosine-5)-methyltransferase 1